MAADGTTTIVRPLGSYEELSSARHWFGWYRRVMNTCRYVRARSGDSSSPSASSPKAEVEAALARVVLKLDVLRVAIAGEGTAAPQFVRVPSINLRDHLRFEEVLADSGDDYDDGGGDGDEELMRLVERQHDELFEEIERRPPWRVVVVQRGQAGGDHDGVGGASEGHSANGDVVLDIMFAFHHSISDGGGGGLFHSHLLEALAIGSGSGSPSPPAELRDHVLDLSSHLCLLPPPQEDLIGFRFSWPFRARVAWNRVAPTWLQLGRPRAAGALLPWTSRPVNLDTFRTSIRLFTIPRETVDGLVQASREHGTTLTALLHVLTLVSLSRRLLPSGAGGEDVEDAHAHNDRGLPPLWFAADTPVSLRRYTNRVDRTTMTVPLVTGHRYEFGPELVARIRQLSARAPSGGGGKGSGGGDSGDDDSLDKEVEAKAREEEVLIWDLARDLRASFKQLADRLPLDDEHAGLRKLTPGGWMGRLLEQVGKPRNATWEVSNIGVLDMRRRRTPNPNPGDDNDDGDHDSSCWCVTRSFMSQGPSTAGPAITLSVATVAGGPCAVTVSWQEGMVDGEVVIKMVADISSALARFGEEQRFGLLV